MSSFKLTHYRVSDRLWSMEDIAELVEAAAPKPGRPVTYKKRLE